MNKNNHRINFVLVIEAGDLEIKSVLLIKSIRKFGGEFSDCPIWAVQPRLGRNLSEQTLNALFDNDVIFIKANLNRRVWKDYPLANKPYAAAFIESIVFNNVDTLVFLDSDIIFCQFPKQLLLNENEIVAIRAVDEKGVGLSMDELIDKYWEIIYDTCNVDISQIWSVKPTLNECFIRAYFNGGLVSVKPNRRIFQKWKENLEKLSMIEKIDGFSLLKEKFLFLEQSVLAATILANTSRSEVRLFNKDYNYPLNFHNVLTEKYQKKILNEIKIIHYHSVFYNLDWKNDIKIEEPLLSWLLNRLPLPNLRKSLINRMPGNKFLSKALINKSVNKINS